MKNNTPHSSPISTTHGIFFSINLLLLALLIITVTSTKIYAEETTISITKLAPLPAISHAELLAGIAEVDITPPPGTPLSGHSTWSNVSVGVRTKLKARAFYIKAPNTPAIALVQLDLLTGELMLHHRVAELIAPHTDIASAQLNLSATHTHAGPGQYHSSNAYNIFSSSKAGFDPEIFQFLSDRISQAVITAYKNRRPAKIATGSIDIWGSTRNRAMGPFYANPENPPGEGAVEKFYAINPSLFMVRIDGKAPDNQYYPMGAFSTFSIHGTGVLTKSMKLLNGDVWSYISQTMETRAQTHYQPPWPIIHGAVEGTHGDIAPNATRAMMGFMEAKRIGSEIGEQAWALFSALEQKLTKRPTIKMGAKEIDVIATPQINDITLCASAAFSMAQTAGPDEHSSYLLYDIPPFKRGWPKKYFQNCHAEKRIVGSFLQRWVLAPEDFPKHLMIQATQINDLLLVSLPFEVTVTSGVRIRQAIQQWRQQETQDALPSFQHIAIGSVANGYFGYATTPEEYQLQWYEGGSTIYGPNTTPFLAAHTQALLQSIYNHNESDLLPNQWVFTLKKNSFLPTITTSQPINREQMSAAEFIDAAINQEPFWRWQWWDLPPAEIELDKPLVSIEEKLPDQVKSPNKSQWQEISNDEGYDIAIIFKGQLDQQQRGLYELHWYNPPLQPQAKYRIKILARDKAEVFTSGIFN